MALAVGLLGACTPTASIPDDASSCSDLVDLALTVVVDARDSASGLAWEDLSGPAEGDEGDTEAVFNAMSKGMDAISIRSSELGCDPGKWNAEYQRQVLELAPLTLGGLFVLSSAVSPMMEPF
jgi:hypothetical protein